MTTSHDQYPQTSSTIWKPDMGSFQTICSNTYRKRLKKITFVLLCNNERTGIETFTFSSLTEKDRKKTKHPLPLQKLLSSDITCLCRGKMLKMGYQKKREGGGHRLHSSNTRQFRMQKLSSPHLLRIILEHIWVFCPVLSWSHHVHVEALKEGAISLDFTDNAAGE